MDIYDFSTFKDSVSLVCDPYEKFCGDKELVLTDPADGEISMTTSNAFYYDNLTRKLVITPENIMSEEGNY